MVHLTLQPDHAYVVASFIGMYLVNQFLGGTVGAARAKYGVKLPIGISEYEHLWEKNRGIANGIL